MGSHRLRRQVPQATGGQSSFKETFSQARGEIEKVFAAAETVAKILTVTVLIAKLLVVVLLAVTLIKLSRQLIF